MIQECLDSGIKDIIARYPPVAEALRKYDIGCIACTQGTCQLKDVVEIHNLEEDDQRALMKAIFEIIYPGQNVELPPSPRRKKTSSCNYSPPLKKLVEEHRLIKRLLALIPALASSLDIESAPGKAIARGCIEFIQGFADKYHHAKEEDILFKCFDENQEIIQTMYADHERARAHTRQMLSALERGDRAALLKELEDYWALLSEHIKKEDEILYRWMDSRLSMAQIGELYSKFCQKDQEFAEKPIKHAEFIEGLEKQFQSGGD
jgi:hemerythrin-like domain-containing protein